MMIFIGSLAYHAFQSVISAARGQFGEIRNIIVQPPHSIIPKRWCGKKKKETIPLEGNYSRNQTNGG